MAELLLVLSQILKVSYKTLSSKKLCEIINMYEEFAPFDIYGIRLLDIIDKNSDKIKEEAFIEIVTRYLKMKYKISI